MASPRLTKEQVHSAAAALDREGKKPTAMNVRDALGSGSYTTILKFLADYDGGEPEDGPPGIPDAPPNALAAVWSAAYTAAWREFRETLENVQTVANRHLDAVTDLEELSEGLQTRLTEKTRDLEKALRDLRDAEERHAKTVATYTGQIAAIDATLETVKKERDKLFTIVQRSLALEEPNDSKPTPKPKKRMEKPITQPYPVVTAPSKEV